MPRKSVKSNAKKRPSKSNVGVVNDRRTKLLRESLMAVAGQNAFDLVDIFKKENVNEFDIANRLKMTINQTRNILYKLADDGLVGFIRKKDKKNGGWYTYFWTLNVEKSLVKLREKLKRDIENFESQLHSKQLKRFYHCENCEIEMSEENALGHNFTCPECGEVFQLKDNAQNVEQLQKDIVVFKENLVSLDEEIAIIVKKAESLKARRLKAEKKRKSEKRRAAAALRKALKEKEAKKLAKAVKRAGKKVKKKTVKDVKKPIAKKLVKARSKAVRKVAKSKKKKTGLVKKVVRKVVSKKSKRK